MALCSCFPVFHLVIGLMMISNPKFFGANNSQPPPAAIGWFFTIVAGAIILLGWIVSLLVIIAGRSLTRRKHYLFCLIVAGIECIFMPFGTVLGVFTIIVLVRPSVKTLFGESAKAV